MMMFHTVFPKMIRSWRSRLSQFRFSVRLKKHWRRGLPVGLTFCAGLGLTAALFLFMRSWERHDNQKEFAYAARHFVEIISRTAERVELTHEVMRQDFLASDGISREEFSLCLEPFLTRVPSLKVLQWAPCVADSQRRSFEQSAQREGLPDFHIVEPDPQGRLLPAQRRDVYYPILYAATKTGFQARFGWDFAANPALLKAIDQCRDTGRYVVSGLVDLTHIGIPGPVIQTFLPVYRNVEDIRSPEGRRAGFKGVLVGLCNIGDLVSRSLEYASGPQGIDVALVDLSAPAGKQMLFYHFSRTRAIRNDSSIINGGMKPAGIHHAATIDYGGRRWEIVCSPAPGFFTARASWRSWTVLVIGLIVSGLSSAYVSAAATRTERIQQVVTERTLELRAKDDQLRQSQKMEAGGALAGGIAHEFNNLLQAIGGYTRYAMESLKPDEQAYQDLGNVLTASDRAKSLTRQLLSFSRRQSVERKNIDANQMVGDVTKMLRPLLSEQIRLKVILGPDVGTIFADAGSFQQVLMNLCLNARDAMPNGGDIVVKTKTTVVSPEFAELYTELKPGRYVELSVADTGHGIPPSVREHIFEPFFTTKPIGKGTGLGLSVVYGIVQQHEGSIHVYSEPNQGTVFKIYLPAVESHGDDSSDAPVAQLFHGTETILVAEDDPMVRDIACRILEKAGYRVIAVSDGDKALPVFRQRHDEISLVVLDAIMPKLSGHDAYRCIKSEYPEAKVIFCSGYDPETAQSQFVADECLRLVEKPYDPETLLRTVREVLEAGEPCPTH